MHQQSAIFQIKYIVCAQILHFQQPQGNTLRILVGFALRWVRL